MLKSLICILYKIQFYFNRILCIVRTRMTLLYNSVDHKSFQCYGVPHISVEKGCNFSIGENFSMNNAFSANRMGFMTPCVFRCAGGNIMIGNNVGISQTVLIASGSDIIIRDNVRLGSGVKLYTSNFHSLNHLHRRDWNVDRLHRESKPIILEEDCFIGAGSIILKGVTVGARSIVGAGSIVTKSIPCDEMWAGNPAKFIKKLN